MIHAPAEPSLLSPWLFLLALVFHSSRFLKSDIHFDFPASNLVQLASRSIIMKLFQSRAKLNSYSALRVDGLERDKKF